MRDSIDTQHTGAVLRYLSLVVLLCGTALWGQLRDPGPRPVGTTARTFGGGLGQLKGPSFGQSPNDTTLFNTAIVDTAQPPDGRGNEGAGRVLAGIDAQGPPSNFNTEFWWSGLAFFGQTASVNGAPDAATSNPTIFGLGPGFNGNSCAMCHSFPAIGGTAVGPTNENPNTVNPQFTLAHDKDNQDPAHPLNPVPLSFITSSGPIREARFITKPDGTLDGGVHDLFSIEGRNDAPADCTLAQPAFDVQVSADNVIFRIPTPTFGLGLVEAIPDQTLIDNLAQNSGQLGVAGHFNHSGNDGTISRFGWKAQNKSLLLFAGEATNVELGVTNELFTNERTPGVGCVNNLSFEDLTHVNGLFRVGKAQIPLNQGSSDPDIAGEVSSLIENFAIFMRFNGTAGQCAFNSDTVPNPNNPALTQSRCFSLDNQVIPPAPFGAPNPSQDAVDSIARGAQQFNAVGCNLCHTPQLTTGPSNQLGLSNRTITPFSDFALHHMGGKLADGVTQGEAGPDEFRTAPLWGLGQRVFLLHDGRTTDLLVAISNHSDAHLAAAGAPTCFDTTATQGFNIRFGTTTQHTRQFTPSSTSHSCASEANQVINNFLALPDVTPSGTTTASKQDILNFLRSL